MTTTLRHRLNLSMMRSNAMLFRLWTSPTHFDGTRASWHLCVNQALSRLELAKACRKEINQNNK